MQTNQLGKSDMHITRLGVGSWAMGGLGYQYSWGPQDDQESIEAIHKALDFGINCSRLWKGALRGDHLPSCKRMVGKQTLYFHQVRFALG